MNLHPVRPQRGPALVTAAILLAYAVGKAVYASQSRLGLPTGPVVPAADYARYADATLGVAENQWLAAVTGVVGAAVVLASVGRVGQRLPRALMLIALALAFVGLGAGAAVMVVDGFVGLGIGWQWYHGVVGLVTLTAFALTIREYARAGVRRAESPMLRHHAQAPVLRRPVRRRHRRSLRLRPSSHRAVARRRRHRAGGRRARSGARGGAA